MGHLEVMIVAETVPLYGSLQKGTLGEERMLLRPLCKGDWGAEDDE